LDTHAAHPIGFRALARSLRANADLLGQLVRRDVAGRYKGSMLGLLWSFLNPVVMLVVYTVVFSVVFKARWPGGGESRTEFALVLFTGLMVFNLFSECVNRAPSLVVGNVNYVKKVVFPLEILPIVSLGTAGFHFLVSLLAWLFFYVIFFGVPHAAFLQLPIVLVPLVLLTAGLCWLLASLAAYLRDVGQVVSVFTTVLLFLSPVFFPVSVLPPAYQQVVRWSPLTYIVEQARDVMVWGRGVDWPLWSVHTAACAAIAWLGFAWFQKTRRGFADVL
jgi:lipopolysaccharide transport system permease protein